MISAIITIQLTKENLEAEHGYKLLREITSGIKAADDWFVGVNTPQQKSIPLRQKEAVIERLQERARLMTDGRAVSDFFSAFLTSDIKGKRAPGLIDIDFAPSIGRATISIYKPDQKFDDPVRVVLETLVAFIEADANVEFAFVNVYDKVNGSFQYYSADYATFPHRRCLGWMAYVPMEVTREQLPLAANIVATKGGSIIMALNEVFDLANKEHIKRANQIEMDMNDLGLLAVTDPTF